MDLKIFVLTPDDIRLSRRIQRDIAERGRTVRDVLVQYCRFVKPAYDDFIKPTMKHSDIIVPFRAYNNNAVNMLVQTLRIKLQVNKRQIEEQRNKPSRMRSISEHEADAVEKVGQEDFDREKLEAELSLKVEPMNESLTFEIVDRSKVE